jgi:hypothetical protein
MLEADSVAFDVLAANVVATAFHAKLPQWQDRSSFF